MACEKEKTVYEYLRKHYDYSDGDLIRKEGIPGCSQGKSIGSYYLFTDSKIPYLQVKLQINGIVYNTSLARAVWLYHNGTFPDCLNYLDDNPMNTRIENLMEIPVSQFKMQRSQNAKGYLYHASRKKYNARITINKKYVSLGMYDTAKEATAMYTKARDYFLRFGGDAKDVKKYIQQFNPNIKV